jgi:hypothetical protein
VRQVAAAVVIEDERLLPARRPPWDALAGLWALPEGKIEPKSIGARSIGPVYVTRGPPVLPSVLC